MADSRFSHRSSEAHQYFSHPDVCWWFYYLKWHQRSHTHINAEHDGAVPIETVYNIWWRGGLGEHLSPVSDQEEREEWSDGTEESFAQRWSHQRNLGSSVLHAPDFVQILHTMKKKTFRTSVYRVDLLRVTPHSWRKVMDWLWTSGSSGSSVARPRILVSEMTSWRVMHHKLAELWISVSRNPEWTIGTFGECKTKILLYYIDSLGHFYRDVF